MLFALILVSLYAYAITGYVVVQKTSDPFQRYPWFSWEKWFSGVLWPVIIWLLLCLLLAVVICEVGVAWREFKLKRIAVKSEASAKS